MFPKIQLVGPISLILLVACSSPPPQLFLQTGHRFDYALQPDELRAVAFYIDRRVLAQREEPAGEATPESVVIVPAQTPGRVTDVGPDWLRVRFTEGGAGAVFKTTPNPESDSAYWLATELPGGGYEALRNLEDKTLVVEGVRYRIITGQNVRLLIDSKGLSKLIEARPHATGISPP